MSAGFHGAGSNCGYVGRCPDCGKMRFQTRKQARKHARVRFPGDKRFSEYKCGDYWHIGHLPEHIVRRGVERAR